MAPFFLSEGCKLLEVGQHYSVVDSRKPIQYGDLGEISDSQN